MSHEVVVFQDENRMIVDAGDNEIILEAISLGGDSTTSIGDLFQTEEEFTITVDPVNGTDPLVRSIITTQGEADSLGPVKTIPAAVFALPSWLRHRVTMALADGVHQMTVDFFGDLARFLCGITPITGQIFPGPYGGITFTSLNGLVRSPGTVTMGVASSGLNTLVLDSDPSHTADAFRGRMAVIVGGTGLGEFRPITSHSGVNVTLAGNWVTPPDDSSTVEFQQAAAELLTPVGLTTPDITAYRPGHYKLNRAAFRFEAIDLTGPAGGATIGLEGGSWTFGEGCRLLNLGFNLEDVGVNFETCTVDGGGVLLNIIITGGVTRIRSQFGKGWYFRGATSSPVRLLGGGSNANGNASWSMFGGTVDGSSGFGVEAEGSGASLNFKTEIVRGSGHAFALRTRHGGSIVGSEPLMTDSEFISGSTDAIALDDVQHSYAEIAADVDKVAIGKHGSRVIMT